MSLITKNDDVGIMTVDGCENCEFFRNSETECGCAAPFPIDHCKRFQEMEKEKTKED